jgi:hypothetical protein
MIRLMSERLRLQCQNQPRLNGCRNSMVGIARYEPAELGFVASEPPLLSRSTSRVRNQQLPYAKHVALSQADSIRIDILKDA